MSELTELRSDVLALERTVKDLCNMLTEKHPGVKVLGLCVLGSGWKFDAVGRLTNVASVERIEADVRVIGGAA